MKAKAISVYGSHWQIRFDHENSHSLQYTTTDIYFYSLLHLIFSVYPFIEMCESQTFRGISTRKEVLM